VTIPGPSWLVPMPPPMPSPSFSTSEAEPVDSLRLPAEQLLVEADESVAVLACDLEVNDRVCHGADSLLGFVYDP